MNFSFECREPEARVPVLPRSVPMVSMGYPIRPCPHVSPGVVMLVAAEMMEPAFFALTPAAAVSGREVILLHPSDIERGPKRVSAMVKALDEARQAKGFPPMFL